MIWKHEVNVDDANTAKKFKQEILAISPDIVVSVTKNKSQWLVRSSVEKVGGGLDNKVIVTRALKTLYEKYTDKISYRNESVKKKSTLRKLVEKVVREARKDRLVPYIIKYTYVDFKAKKRAEGTLNWDEKRDGKPTEQALKKYRDGFNKSMQKGGANHHLAAGSSPMGTLSAIDQRTGKVVAKYTPPPFETVDEAKETWTPERVKEELPDVKVKLPNGKIVTGKVYGRKNQFANVVIKTDAGDKSEEFAWTTLARALNNNSSVTI